MKNKFIEYPMKNIIEWIIVKPLTIISTISYFLFLIISIRNIGQPLYVHTIILVSTIIVNLLHRLVIYILGQKNSERTQLSIFNGSLNTILHMYLPIKSHNQIKKIDELENALLTNKFSRETKHSFTRIKHTNLGIRFLYKASAIKKYKIRFIILRYGEEKTIPVKKQTEFNFLVIEKNNEIKYSDQELTLFSGIIILDEFGISEFKHYYLEIPSSSDKLDLFTRIFYFIFRKEFTIFLPWQTISLTRFINLKLLSKK